jgi:hypothetical protein
LQIELVFLKNIPCAHPSCGVTELLGLKNPDFADGLSQASLEDSMDSLELIEESDILEWAVKKILA